MVSSWVGSTIPRVRLGQRMRTTLHAAVVSYRQAGLIVTSKMACAGQIVTVSNGAGRSVTVSNWLVGQTSRHLQVVSPVSWYSMFRSSPSHWPQIQLIVFTVQQTNPGRARPHPASQLFFSLIYSFIFFLLPRPRSSKHKSARAFWILYYSAELNICFMSNASQFLHQR
jgi:hypothetical protein